jgi:F-type H+-transporting ATPase subunit alpha
VELLKQPQYAPLSMEEQVAVIFAGTSGAVDSVELSQVRRFESEMLEFLHLKKQGMLDEIRDKKAMDKELLEKLAQTIQEFKETSFK